MMNQQAKCSPLGLKTENVGETHTDGDVKDEVLRGEVQLVYITPENIIETRNMLPSSPYHEKLIALVDEVHYIKTWGWEEQVRSTFAKIGCLRSINPQRVNMMVLIATATMDIVTQLLAMDNPSLITLLPHRYNNDI